MCPSLAENRTIRRNLAQHWLFRTQRAKVLRKKKQNPASFQPSLTGFHSPLQLSCVIAGFLCFSFPFFFLHKQCNLEKVPWRKCKKKKVVFWALSPWFNTARLQVFLRKSSINILPRRGLSPGTRSVVFGSRTGGRGPPAEGSPLSCPAEAAWRGTQVGPGRWAGRK